ncbi:MAG: energy transducer TonB [Alistipes sp.]|nr:energy transducer TonB [Alistipes sp.]
MEVKKNPKVDVNRLRIVLLEIGLIVALLVVIAAFLYTPREVTVEKIDMNYGPVEEQITEITRQDQKPPEPPKKTEITVITDILNIVTNDTKISTEVDFAEFEEDVEIIQQVAVEEEVIEDDQPFVKVEEMPTFQGGDLNTFRNWVQSKVRYPQIAQENNISGRVFLMFVVERDGSLTNIQVLQTPDSSLSDEAIRVLKTSPKWKPGKQRNQTVRVKYTLPIDFRIQN